MTDQGDRSDEDYATGIKGSGDEGSDSSFSDFSSEKAPGSVKKEFVDEDDDAGRGVEKSQITKKNTRKRKLNPPSSPKFLFHPNEKGTKKQKRCDYDSDSRSYDGLGFEYKRKTLSTTARRDTLLPQKVRMVDFDHQGNKKWGTRLLFETLDESEIDTLVGLANLQTTPVSSSSTATFHDPQWHNPLLSVSFDAPLPPSQTHYIKSRIQNNVVVQRTSDDEEDRRKGKKKDSKGKYENIPFDDSAAVALGMYLEECITASLLPLAGLHALRCQAIESMESAEAEFDTMPVESYRNGEGHDEIRSNHASAYALHRSVPHPVTGDMVTLDMKNKIRWKEESAFQEWTLPPEEAILKLMEQGLLSKDSPRRFVPNASRSFATTQSNEASIDSPLDIRTWAKGYKIDPNVVFANREIYDIFMPRNTASLENES